MLNETNIETMFKTKPKSRSKKGNDARVANRVLVFIIDPIAPISAIEKMKTYLPFSEPNLNKIGVFTAMNTRPENIEKNNIV